MTIFFHITQSINYRSAKLNSILTTQPKQIVHFLSLEKICILMPIRFFKQQYLYSQMPKATEYKKEVSANFPDEKNRKQNKIEFLKK